MIPDFEPNERSIEEEARAFRRFLHVVAFVVLAGAGGGVVVAFAGCPAGPSLSDQQAVAAYETRQLACVAEAGTRLEADQCRCAVMAQYHRAGDCWDGGAP